MDITHLAHCPLKGEKSVVYLLITGYNCTFQPYMLSQTLKLKGLNYAFLALLFGLKYLYVNLSLNIKLYYRSEKQTHKENEAIKDSKFWTGYIHIYIEYSSCSRK
uniref:Uncharacterized protein n=1 Tax=Glossina palpalis gambiensis TaxID=67801 RepID=A0A1B0BX26_9MUSC